MKYRTYPYRARLPHTLVLKMETRGDLMAMIAAIHTTLELGGKLPAWQERPLRGYLEALQEALAVVEYDDEVLP